MAISTLHDSFHTTPTGFVVVRDGERRVYRDQDVVGIRTRLDYSPAGWSEASVRQSLDLQLADLASDWITVASDLETIDVDDHLQSFRSRLLKNLADRAWDLIQQGREWSDTEWSLSLTGLRERATDLVLPPQVIARADWQGDEFCIWHEDAQLATDAPAMRIGRQAPNTLLLEVLLHRLVPATQTTPPELSPIGLGKLINQIRLHDEHESTRWLMVGVAALLLLLSLNSISPGILGVGLLGLLMATLVLMPRIRGRRELLDHYEHGLVWHRGFHQQRLYFEHIASFAARSPSTPGDWQRARAKLRLRFLTTDSHGLPLDIVIPLEQRTERIEQAQSLQAHITSLLANRMQSQLQRLGSVRWTNQLTILPDALEVTLPSGERQRVRYSQFETSEFACNHLRLGCAAIDGIIEQPADDLNFFPGLLLAKLRGLAV